MNKPYKIALSALNGVAYAVIGSPSCCILIVVLPLWFIKSWMFFALWGPVIGIGLFIKILLVPSEDDDPLPPVLNATVFTIAYILTVAAIWSLFAFYIYEPYG